MDLFYFLVFETPIDDIYIESTNEQISGIYIGESDFLEQREGKNMEEHKNDVLLEVKQQLLHYFQGKRKQFQLPILQSGTAFQTAVWKQLVQIPYGETRSYQFIAEAIGNKNAVRAIGQANKANQLPIIVPCHRVIGKNQSLTGYAGKRTDIKEQLLTLEGASFRQ